ncbi:MAG: hypothetical protein H7A33_00895 [Deltaproteobacteria bacterium]|nr:hypothetical protein [Deltaproteobacteria bacterium]
MKVILRIILLLMSLFIILTGTPAYAHVFFDGDTEWDASQILLTDINGNDDFDLIVSFPSWSEEANENGAVFVL